MKIDKEFVVKYHFWILLGVYAPMALVALLLVWTTVAGAVDQGASELKKTKEGLGKASGSNLKNNAWIDVLRKKEERLEGQKNAMWEQVWEAQKVIMTWPSFLLQRFPSLKDAYFLDKLESDLREKYANDNNTYYTQLDHQGTGIVHIVEPVNNRGIGTVQFRGGWQSILTYVPKGKWPPIPDSDDCWLAQEDIWVQRELLLCIKEANDFSAIYRKQPNAPKPAKGEIDHQIFTNPRWKLDLILTPNELKWQITNLSARRQPLSMHFLVKRKNTSTRDKIWVDGEPLAPGQSSKWDSWPLKAIGLTGLEGVTEVLDWRSAAVKRIDKIDLYHHSNRTSAKSFTTPPVKVDPNAPPEASAATPGMAPGGVPGMGMKGMGDSGDAPGGMMPGGPFGMGMGGMGGMGMQQMLVNKYRYVDINDQVRRMALGVVLIVDQSRIQDVLTAFANSRLRFQITQVHWQHYNNSIKPPVVSDPNTPVNFNYSTEDRPPPGMSFSMSGVSAPTGDEPGGVSAAGGRMPPMPSAPMGGDQTAIMAGSDESANVVELAIYGIGSLYQRYPPKPPEGSTPAADAGAAPAAGTPAPPK